MAELFKLARIQKTSADLGCGSLILIAIVVYVISGRSLGELQTDVKALQAEIHGLRLTVESQAAEIRLLRESLGARPTPPADKTP